MNLKKWASIIFATLIFIATFLWSRTENKKLLKSLKNKHQSDIEKMKQTHTKEMKQLHQKYIFTFKLTENDITNNIFKDVHSNKPLDALKKDDLIWIDLKNIFDKPNN